MQKKTLFLAMFVLAGLAFASTGALVVGAWHIVSPLSTKLSSTTPTIGDSITDTASIQISNNGPPFGSIVFQVYSGTCTDNIPTGTLQAGFPGATTSSTVSVTSAAELSGGASYTSAAFSTAGLKAGSYVFVAKYGGGGYPSSAAPCEPFTLMPKTIGTPEFPLSGALGMLLVFAMAVPLLVAARKFRSPMRMP